MGQVIVCSAFKGGVGKTTSATNIAAVLAKMGYSVCLWDCDFQANATMGFKFDPEQLEGRSLYEVIHGEKTVEEVILRTNYNVFVVPSSDDLSAFDVDVFQNPDGFPPAKVPFVLRDIIAGVRDNFDYHIIDTGPSLSLLTVNTMVAADMFLVATQLRRFGVRGTQKYVERMLQIRGGYVPEPAKIHVFPTFNSKAKNISSVAHQELLRWAAELPEVHVTQTSIPDRAVFENAQAFRGLPAALVESEKEEGVAAYYDLVREIILR